MKVSIKIPKVGLTVEDVVFTEWAKECGSMLELGEIIAIVESDKTTFEIPAPTDANQVICSAYLLVFAEIIVVILWLKTSIWFWL